MDPLSSLPLALALAVSERVGGTGHWRPGRKYNFEKGVEGGGVQVLNAVYSQVRAQRCSPVHEGYTHSYRFPISIFHPRLHHVSYDS